MAAEVMPRQDETGGDLPAETVSAAAAAPHRPRRWLVGIIVPGVFAGLGLLTWESLPYPLGTSSGLMLIAILAICTATDLRWQKIPNWATYPGFLWGLGINAAASILDGPGEEPPVVLLGREIAGPLPLGAIGIGGSLLGAAACFGVMALCTGWLKTAGGDVKLATVIGAFLGPRYGLLALCFGYILSGVTSALFCLWHYGAWNILRGGLQWIGHAVAPLMVDRPEVRDAAMLRSPVPLGGYFMIGALLALSPIPGLTR